MPFFEYKAKDKGGKLLTGQISSEDRDKLAAKLKKQGLTPIEINEVSRTQPRKKTEEKKQGFKKEINFSFTFGVSEEELVFFTRQFATILNAGLSLDRIITILHNQTKNPRLKEAIYQIGKDLQKGSSIFDAMSKHKNIFNDIYLSMVRVGETSGNLPPTISRLADMIEKNIAVKKKIKAAMSYPIFIFAFSAILSYVLIAVFLPGFIPMFQGVGLNLQKEYPLTYFLIQLSNIATNPLLILLTLIIIACIAIGINVLVKTPKGQLFMDKLMFQIPGFSGVIKQAAVARFCRSYANLANSGIPVMQALSLVAGASGNLVITQSIERIANQVKEGTSLSETMQREAIFPDIVVQMVHVGEEAGSMPEMFARTADYLEQSLDNNISVSYTHLTLPTIYSV